MRIRVLVPALCLLTLLTGAAVAAPASVQATCTAAQKAQRQALVTAYQKKMGAARKAFFAHHRSAKLRKAFTARQQARLKALTQAASCTAGTPVNPDATRMDALQKYVGQVQALNAMFDPATSDDADTAIGTLAQDEQDCADDPSLPSCPLDSSEYSDTATEVKDAATPLNQLATKLATITAPSMAVGDYDASAAACGVDLVTVSAAQKSLHDKNASWATTVTGWGTTFAAGKSPDYSTAD